MKKSILSLVKTAILRVTGALLAGFAVSAFFTPNKIVNGGLSGIATILYHTMSVPAAVTIALINVVLIALSMKFLGKKFIINTIISTALYSGAVQLFSSMPALTDDVLLASIFGGVIYGLGLGIVFSTGSSSGGTDIIGKLLQKLLPGSSIGNMLFAADGAIIVASLIIFKKVDLALYGIVALFVSTFAIDWFIGRLNLSSIAFVISSKGEEISRVLVSTSPRGVTIIDVVGAYTLEDRKMLFCALKKHETADFKRKILEIDNEAFVVFAESPQIMGNGFYIYS